MTPAFKNGFADELQKIAAGPAAAVLPWALKAGKAVLSSPTARGMAADAGTNMLGSFMSRQRSQATGMKPPVGGLP